MSCTFSVVSTESVAKAKSVPSDLSTCPLEPKAKATGFPLASPTIILPLARPAIFDRATASSAILAVVILESAIFAVVTFASVILAVTTASLASLAAVTASSFILAVVTADEAS